MRLSLSTRERHPDWAAWLVRLLVTVEVEHQRLTSPPELCPPLEQDLRTGAVVVGAGYHDLSTALELRARGVDTILLERDFAGSGANGRTAGYLAGGLGLQFELIIKRLGRDGAAAAVRFYDE